jgi:phosphonate transport system permease protein
MTAANRQVQRSPVLAFLLALIPGLGQIYAGRRGRGLAVLLFVPTLIALISWRLSVGGVGFVGPAAQAPSEEQVRAAVGMGAFLALILVLVYVWSLLDAVGSARNRPTSARGVVILGTMAFLIVGWDVTQIDVSKAIRDFSKLGIHLGELAWPWPAAFVKDIAQTQASVQIDVPCGPKPPEAPAEVPGSPYIEVTPLCGEMVGPRQLDGSRKPGTTLHVVGRGFRPNDLVQAWWEPPVSPEFRPRAGGDFVYTHADAQGSFTLDLEIPNFSLPGGSSDPSAVATSKLTLRQEREEGTLHPSDNLMRALNKIVETIFLGLMATFFGSIFAVPLSFLAARNLMSGNAVSLLVYNLVRGVFNIIRSIDPLIWAIIVVIWVGLGPFGGTLALSLHTIASNGKLFSEAIEGIEPGQIEAVQATGANWLQVIVYAIIPQVLPPFISFTIYRWDLNIRSSTIIGAVGGGGIGFLLIEWIRLSDYRSAGIAVWLIAIVVTVLDYASTEIRKQFV